jgi:hypothetical protein
MELPETVQFDCQSCQSTLEVPAAYFGATGPCPYCGGTATAPTLNEWAARQSTAKTATAPEVRRPRNVPDAPADPLGSSRDHRSHLQKLRDRLRRNKAPRFDATSLSLPQILGWGTMLLALAAGILVFLVARYSEPLRPPPRVITLPSDLTNQVIAQKSRLESERTAVMERARELVANFLEKGSAGAEPLGFATFGSQPAVFAPKLFADITLESLATTQCVRKPGTEDFLITVEPKDGRGPVLLVEQKGTALTLHADAFSQQIDDTLNTFLDAPGEASTLAYVLARPSLTKHPLNELAAWPKLDIQFAFPNENPRQFIACAAPQSEVAALIQQRKDTAHWSRAILEFRWSQSPQSGKRFIEIIRVIQHPWGKF